MIKINMYFTALIRQCLALCAGLLFLTSAGAATLPSTAVADWSGYLDNGWTCGAQVGARWDQWKKSVLLFASSNGYGFRGRCNRVANRPGVILVILRDNNHKAQYVGWYDSDSDRNGESTFSGIMTLEGQTDYDMRERDPLNHPLLTYAQKQDFYAWFYERFQVDQGEWEHIIVPTFRSYSTRVNGCAGQFSVCGSGDIKFPRSFGWAYINIDLGDDASGENVSASWGDVDTRPDGFDRFIRIAFTVILTIGGGEIGQVIGLVPGSAANAAFSAAFGNFSSGIIQGLPLNVALLQGIKGAGLAYAGTLVVNSFGDPDALVGVSGAGCPTGDQCWYFQMANGFPPLKNLAELHDPFINWSVKAFGSVAENGWYKAITIPPFLVPGCLATSACVTAGLTIVREDEAK